MSLSQQHPAIGTTDELELQPPDLTLSPITPQEDLNEFKLCSELKLPPDQCINEVWRLPTLFDETSTTVPPAQGFLESTSLFSQIEKPTETKEISTEEKDDKEEDLSIPPLVRQSHSEPYSSISPPIYLISMMPLQDDLWDSNHGQSSWDIFVRDTKTGKQETDLLPEYTLKRNMRIAMMSCAYQLSGCELLSQLRICMHKWFSFPQFDNYIEIESRLLSGDLRTIRQICEEFTPQESALLLEGIYRQHHSHLNEFHLS